MTPEKYVRTIDTSLHAKFYLRWIWICSQIEHIFGKVKVTKLPNQNIHLTLWF